VFGRDIAHHERFLRESAEGRAIGLTTRHRIRGPRTRPTR
jgi:hypothetical protein